MCEKSDNYWSEGSIPDMLLLIIYIHNLEKRKS